MLETEASHAAPLSVKHALCLYHGNNWQRSNSPSVCRRFSGRGICRNGEAPQEPQSRVQFFAARQTTSPIPKFGKTGIARISKQNRTLGTVSHTDGRLPRICRRYAERTLVRHISLFYPGRTDALRFFPDIFSLNDASVRPGKVIRAIAPSQTDQLPGAGRHTFSAAAAYLPVQNNQTVHAAQGPGRALLHTGRRIALKTGEPQRQRLPKATFFSFFLSFRNFGQSSHHAAE